MEVACGPTTLGIISFEGGDLTNVAHLRVRHLKLLVHRHAGFPLEGQRWMLSDGGRIMQVLDGSEMLIELGNRGMLRDIPYYSLPGRELFIDLLFYVQCNDNAQLRTQTFTTHITLDEDFFQSMQSMEFDDDGCVTTPKRICPVCEREVPQVKSCTFCFHEFSEEVEEEEHAAVLPIVPDVPAASHVARAVPAIHHIGRDIQRPRSRPTYTVACPLCDTQWVIGSELDRDLDADNNRCRFCGVPLITEPMDLGAISTSQTVVQQQEAMVIQEEPVVIDLLD